MNVTTVLENTLSPDAATRGAAEQQLLQAANTDFSSYIALLSQELANEQAAGHVRIAAGIALKNAFTAKDFNRSRELQQKWLQQTSLDTKKNVKELALQTLGTNNAQAGQAAAQVIAAIAAIELPRELWPELMPTLVRNVGEGADHLKQASLTSIGFICESQDMDLRDSLAQHSNAILTAVVQGARKEEANEDIRFAAITALSDALEFIKTNFDNEGERNYIMQVICEATQATEARIQQAAFGCLNRIMGLYYENMKFYMEKALFGLTIMGMKNHEEDTAKLAVEFWSTVCEEEITIEDDNAQADTPAQFRTFHMFARVACQEVVPVLLHLLTRVEDDVSDLEYNIAKAAYQCLCLYAQTIGSVIIPMVLDFVEKNIRSEDWHNRDAAVSSFGAIMEGPDDQTLEPLVRTALPAIIDMMNDPVVQVKDSAAYCLGRICDAISDAVDPNVHLPPLIAALFNGLQASPTMASSCCWALMNLADRFSGDPGCQNNPLSPHFNDSIGHLLKLTEQPSTVSTLRTAAYEVLSTFVVDAAQDSLRTVAALSDVIVMRLEETIGLQAQIVSVEDRITLEEIQCSLSAVVLSIVQRLEREIAPQADRIMHVLLRILNTADPKTATPDVIFGVVGALANALEQDFAKYMEAFTPFLYNALGNQESPDLCSTAIGLVSDIVRSMGPLAQPYCDTFMNYLLTNLRSTALANQFKPAILQTFGDIAGAIGAAFETYLSVVAQVLQQAANVQVSPEGSYEMFDYVVSLREGIMDAWNGIISAMKSSKPDLLRQYVESIFQLLHAVYLDQNKSEGLLRSSMGVIGDLAETFPQGEYAHLYHAEWVSQMVRETRQNREFSSRTIDTAKWARELVKRQLGGGQGLQQT